MITYSGSYDSDIYVLIGSTAPIICLLINLVNLYYITVCIGVNNKLLVLVLMGRALFEEASLSPNIHTRTCPAVGIEGRAWSADALVAAKRVHTAMLAVVRAQLFTLVRVYWKKTVRQCQKPRQ